MPKRIINKTKTINQIGSHLNLNTHKQNLQSSTSNVNILIPGNESIRQTLINEDIIGAAGIDETDNNARKYSNSEIDDKKMDKIKHPELISTISQNDQSPFSCVQYQTSKNYSFKFGDKQKWRIYNNSNSELDYEDLWFLKDTNNRKQRRKIFVEGKIHRLWNINPNEETFDVSLHLFLSWLATKDEYLLYTKGDNDIQINDDSVNIWCPCVYIPNLIDGRLEIVESAGSKFKVVSYKKFGGFSNENDLQFSTNSKDHSFEIKNAKFFRCKVEISGTFRGDFKLKNFPFDIQDLNLSIMDRSGRGTFLPALRERKYFMNVDSLCYEVKEWDLECAMFEFVDANPIYDNNSFGKALSQFIMRLKYKRNFYMYLIKYVAIIASITALSLLVFTIQFDAVSDRCAFVVGLVLTIAFCDYQKPNTDYTTILDRYVLSNYMYLIALTIITGILPCTCKGDDSDVAEWYDKMACIGSVICFVGYHLIFIGYAMIQHNEEKKKLKQNYAKDIQQMIDEEDEMLHKMRADYTKPLYQYDEMESLTFLATKKKQ